MRFMVIVKATPESEKEGAIPDPQLMTEMGNYNEELIKAGALLALDVLHPSSKGARVKFSDKSRIVVDGPFTRPTNSSRASRSCRSSLSKRPSNSSSVAPTVAPTTMRSKSVKSLRWKTSHLSCPKSRSSTK